MKKSFIRNLPSDYQYRILVAMEDVCTKGIWNNEEVYQHMRDMKLSPGPCKNRVRSDLYCMKKKGLVKVHESIPRTYSITEYGKFVVEQLRPLQAQFLEEVA